MHFRIKFLRVVQCAIIHVYVEFIDAKIILSWFSQDINILPQDSNTRK